MSNTINTQQILDVLNSDGAATKAAVAAALGATAEDVTVGLDALIEAGAVHKPTRMKYAAGAAPAADPAPAAPVDAATDKPATKPTAKRAGALHVDFLQTGYKKIRSQADADGLTGDARQTYLVTNTQALVDGFDKAIRAQAVRMTKKTDEAGSAPEFKAVLDALQVPAGGGGGGGKRTAGRATLARWDDHTGPVSDAPHTGLNARLIPASDEEKEAALALRAAVESGERQVFNQTITRDSEGRVVVTLTSDKPIPMFNANELLAGSKLGEYLAATTDEERRAAKARKADKADS